MPFRQRNVFLVLVCYAGLLTAQPTSNGRTNDLNQDGIPDTLAFADDPTPCDYNYLATFTDGKTGERTGIPHADYCRCHIRSLIPIPPALLRPGNAEALALIKTKLLAEERSTPDPSFAWILRGLATRRQLKKHPHFDLVIDPGLECQAGNVQLPSTYSVPVIGKAFSHLLAGSHFAQPVAANQGYATYYGHNHYQRRDPRADSVVLVATTPNFQIYRTSHGLFAQSSTAYHWLFVTDHALTGAPDKLRWASVGEVAVWENRLLILQHRRPVSRGTAVFLIDLASGRVGRLRQDLFGEPDDRITFTVVDGSLALKATAPGEEEKKDVDLALPLETLEGLLGLL